MSSLDYLELCRLCLVKERVSVPIFEGEGDVRQIFLKIAACLPVKVNREDKLPKKICDDCVYKVELFYQFWNTTANAEKQLLQWLGEVNLEDKQGYVTNVVNPTGMKPDQNTKSRLDGTVMQQVDEQQNNMGIGMMENMGLGMPMMMPNTNQQQITSVPMDSSGNSVQTVQAVPGPSTQTAHSQIQQNQTSTTQQEEEEEESEEDENSDDECDGDEGLPVKEEGEEDPNRTIEPTTFVNVSLACDEAGPSGLQQQKIPEMPEMAIPQTPDGDPKSGAKPRRKGVIVQDDTGRLRLVLIRSKDADDLKAKRIKLENGFEEIKPESSKGGNDEEKEELVQLKPKKPPQIIIKTLKPLPQKLASQYLVSKQPLKKVPVFQSVLKNTTLPITDIKTLKSEKLDGDWTKSPTLEAIEENVDDILNSLQTTCPICEKVFDTPHKLNSHVKKAHRPPYKCNQCDEVFHTEDRLELHKATHQQERVFECDICHMKWRLEKSMKNHKLRCHSDENAALYMCEYCGKSYHLEKDLEYHIKRSHERKLDICRYCGKSVKSIRGHEWRHQQQNGIAQTVYPCHLCRKKFYDQDRLARHLVRHENGLKCEDCGKVYPGKQELGNHRRYKHSLSNFLKCIVCEKTFAVGYFYLHVLTHAGIRPYKCDICEEDFTQRTSLLRHRRQHPGPLPPEPPSQPQIVYQAKRYLQELENSRMLESLANEEEKEDDTDNVTIIEQDTTMDQDTTVEEEMIVETVEDIIVEEDTTIDQDTS